MQQIQKGIYFSSSSVQLEKYTVTYKNGSLYYMLASSEDEANEKASIYGNNYQLQKC